MFSFFKKKKEEIVEEEIIPIIEEKKEAGQLVKSVAHVIVHYEDILGADNEQVVTAE